MTGTERGLYKLLLAADGIAIAISMVAGPLSHTSVAMGAALSAILISLCLLFYGLHFWKK